MATPNGIVLGQVVFNPKDIVTLENRHCAAMLELILTEASLDGVLGALLSTMMGLTYSQGADMIGDLSSSKKFEEMRKLLKNAPTPGAQKAARVMRRHKKSYEKYSEPRNLIAHSHCAGVWAVDRDMILFATFDSPASNLMGLTLYLSSIGPARYSMGLRDEETVVAPCRSVRYDSHSLPLLNQLPGAGLRAPASSPPGRATSFQLLSGRDGNCRLPPVGQGLIRLLFEISSDRRA